MRKVVGVAKLVVDPDLPTDEYDCEKRTTYGKTIDAWSEANNRLTDAKKNNLLSVGNRPSKPFLMSAIDCISICHQRGCAGQLIVWSAMGELPTCTWGKVRTYVRGFTWHYVHVSGLRSCVKENVAFYEVWHAPRRFSSPSPSSSRLHHQHCQIQHAHD